MRQWQLVALLLASAAVALLLHAALTVWPLPPLLAWADLDVRAPTGALALLLTVVVLAPLALLAARLFTAPLARLLRAL